MMQTGGEYKQKRAGLFVRVSCSRRRHLHNLLKCQQIFTEGLVYPGHHRRSSLSLMRQKGHIKDKDVVGISKHLLEHIITRQQKTGSLCCPRHARRDNQSRLPMHHVVWSSSNCPWLVLFLLLYPSFFSLYSTMVYSSSILLETVRFVQSLIDRLIKILTLAKQSCLHKYSCCSC